MKTQETISTAPTIKQIWAFAGSHGEKLRFHYLKGWSILASSGAEKVWQKVGGNSEIMQLLISRNLAPEER